jgi:putative hemin transport protein
MLRKNLTPEAIRALRAEHPKPRARDFAEEQGIAEGQLVAAYVGQPNGPVRIAAEPKRLLPLVTALGDVMALTRNESAVHEKRGVFGEYKGSDHVGLILGKEIDVRVFPSHWVSAYALEEPAEDGSMKRSIQIFDAAGDAVHKIHLKPESDAAAFGAKARLQPPWGLSRLGCPALQTAGEGHGDDGSGSGVARRFPDHDLCRQHGHDPDPLWPG